MFGNMKMIGLGVLGIGVALTIYLGYRHYTRLIEKVNVAEQTATVLQTGLDIERATVRDLRDATGDWKDDRTQLLRHVEEMQEASYEAALETKHLRKMFSEIDWNSVDADSVANATTDRLFSLIASATERGDDRSGETDTASDATTEADRADEG